MWENGANLPAPNVAVAFQQSLEVYTQVSRKIDDEVKNQFKERIMGTFILNSLIFEDLQLF